MKLKKFLNIDIEPAPPELELSVEMRCRDIMQSTDYDNIKRYCTHLIRHQMDQDVFMASMLGRLIELEANLTINQVRKKRKFDINLFQKFLNLINIKKNIKNFK